MTVADQLRSNNAEFSLVECSMVHGTGGGSIRELVTRDDAPKNAVFFLVGFTMVHGTGGGFANL